VSDTKVHDLACLALGTATAATALILKEPSVLLTSAGALSGTLISPDWDWDGFIVETQGIKRLVSSTHYVGGSVVKHVYGKVTRRWPQPIRMWIQVYSNLFTHRGRNRGLSHTWLVGTLIRFSWIGLTLLFFLLPWPTLLFFIGLLAADSVHLLLDYKIKI